MLDRLADLYYGTDANRKPVYYLEEYERFLEPLRTQPLRLLELGVRFGASMQIWRDYLPLATIVGLDIDKKPDAFPSDSRVHFIQGSQDDEAVLAEALRVAGGQFDLIIDDCAHIGHLAARSFSFLFPNALKPGGLYVIEDICTAFLTALFPEAVAFKPEKIGGYTVGAAPTVFPSHQNGLIGVAKQIFDHAMAPTAGLDATPFRIERMIVRSNIVLIEKAPA